jgi:predicted transcriptional regulator
MLDNRLGALEREVLSLVWERGDATVRDVCERLDSTIAYTTVMTTMDRLFKKRLLSRHKVGRAFMYRAVVTRKELEGAIAGELVETLLQRNGSEPLPILSSLVDAVSDRDRALLDALERLVREKRRAIDARRSSGK